MGCCTWRSHLILTWTPSLVCVLGKIKNEIQGFPYLGSVYIRVVVVFFAVFLQIITEHSVSKQ